MASRTEKFLRKQISPVIKQEMKKITEAVVKTNNQGAKNKSEKELELQPFGSSVFAPTEYYNDLNYSQYELLERYFGFVYAAIKAIADDMASIELKLMQVKADGVEEVTSHPALELIQRVNSDMTLGDIIAQLVIHKKLTGNAYWYLVRNRKTVEQIRVLRPDWVRVIPGDYRKGSAVAGYEVSVSGRAPQRVEAQDIIHFKEASAVSTTYGMGVLEACLRTANLEFNAEEWNNAFFKNAASTGGVFIFNGVLSKENRERLLENIKQQYSGLRNAHKSVIIDGGGDYKEAGRTQRDMEFTAMQAWVRDKLLAMFRVSKSILGMAEDFNRANIDGSEYIFAKRVLKPEYKAFTDKLNEFYLPQFENTEDLFFDFVDPVPQDETKLIMKIQALAPSYITPNEARELLNLDPIGEEGDFLYIPTSVQRIDKAGADPVPVQAPQPPVPQQNEAGYVKVKGRPVQKKLSSYAKHYVSKIRNSRKYKRKVEIQEKMLAMKQNIEKALGDIKNPANAMNMEVFWKTMDSEARTYTNQLVSVMHKVFENDQIQIIRALRRNKSALKEKGLSDVIAYLNESRYLKRLIEEEATDVITRANKQQGKRASSFISDKPYNQTPSIKKKLSDNTKKMGTSVMETRRDAIIRQLEEGILAQESIPKLANRLKEYYTDYESNKARQVAQTEVFRAFNMANVDAWDQDGVVTGKQWFTAADERTCEWCAPQHGKIQSLDKSFFDKGYELEGSRGGILNLDYGDVGTPPLHPYCVSADTIVFADDAEKILRIPYSGEMIKLSFADGRNLTVTPNHIVLTTRGWVRAKDLKKTDEVVDSTDAKRIVTSNPDVYKMNLGIENVFSSLAKSSSMSISSMPVTPEDLHGDGKFVDKKIDVISTNGLLRDATDASSFEHVVKSFLDKSHGTGLLDTMRDEYSVRLALLLAADGIMGSNDIGHIISATSSAHHKSICSNLVSNYHTRLNKASSDKRSSDTELLSKIVLGSSGLVSSTKITDIDILTMTHGFVYDISTSSTSYISNGVISSNCRCTLAPIIGGSKIADPTFGGVPVNAKEADFLEENDIKYVERRKNNNGVIARYNRKNNTMYVYDKESVNFQKTLYHELGHAIDREKESKFLSSTIAKEAIAKDRNNVMIYRTIDENAISYEVAKKAFDDALKSSTPSKYINRIKSDPEVFADGYAQFKRNPSEFKSYAPNLYKVFKELF